MTADDALGVRPAGIGERQRAVVVSLDEAVGLETAHHLVDGRRRDLEGARDVRPRDRQLCLPEPEDDLEVLLLPRGRVLVGHVAILGWPSRWRWEPEHAC